jgi:hypothetical protein
LTRDQKDAAHAMALHVWQRWLAFETTTRINRLR